jgi:hypothetical protein
MHLSMCETILRHLRHPDDRGRDDAYFGAAAINHYRSLNQERSECVGW